MKVVTGSEVYPELTQSLPRGVLRWCSSVIQSLPRAYPELGKEPLLPRALPEPAKSGLPLSSRAYPELIQNWERNLFYPELYQSLPKGGFPLSSRGFPELIQNWDRKLFYPELDVNFQLIDCLAGLQATSQCKVALCTA